MGNIVRLHRDNAVWTPPPQPPSPQLSEVTPPSRSPGLRKTRGFPSHPSKTLVTSGSTASKTPSCVESGRKTLSNSKRDSVISSLPFVFSFALVEQQHQHASGIDRDRPALPRLLRGVSQPPVTFTSKTIETPAPGLRPPSPPLFKRGDREIWREDETRTRRGEAAGDRHETRCSLLDDDVSIHRERGDIHVLPTAFLHLRQPTAGAGGISSRDKIISNQIRSGIVGPGNAFWKAQRPKTSTTCPFLRPTTDRGGRLPARWARTQRSSGRRLRGTGNSPKRLPLV